MAAPRVLAANVTFLPRGTVSAVSLVAGDVVPEEFVEFITNEKAFVKAEAVEDEAVEVESEVEAEEPAEDEAVEAIDYSALKKAELQPIAEARGINPDLPVAVLRERLAEADAN